MRKWAAAKVVAYKWWFILISLAIGVGAVVALLFFLPAITPDQLGLFIAVQGVLLLLVQIADMIESDQERAENGVDPDGQ